MKKCLPPLLLALPLVLVLAASADAGEVLSAEGYSIRLPAGFVQADQKRSLGGARIRGRFGSMPLDGSPTVRAYISGSPERPAAMLLLARLDLREPIRDHQELGLRQLQAMESSVENGFDFQQVQLGEYDAIQMEFASEVDGEPHTTRVLTVACGHYLVVMMLETADPRFRGPADTWNDLRATLKIVPRLQRLITFGLIALSGLFLIWVLLRLSRRGGGGAHLRRSIVDSGLVMPTGGGASSGSGLRGSEVRRPTPYTPPARKGLRSTLHDDRS